MTVTLFLGILLGLFTLFGLGCFLVVFPLLDANRFDVQVCAECVWWLFLACLWQVTVGFTLKKVINRRYCYVELTRKRRWQEYARYVELKVEHCTKTVDIQLR